MFLKQEIQSRPRQCSGTKGVNGPWPLRIFFAFGIYNIPFNVWYVQERYASKVLVALPWLGWGHCYLCPGSFHDLRRRECRRWYLWQCILLFLCAQFIPACFLTSMKFGSFQGKLFHVSKGTTSGVGSRAQWTLTGYQQSVVQGLYSMGKQCRSQAQWGLTGYPHEMSDRQASV